MSDETEAGGIFVGTLTDAEHKAAQEAHERTPGTPVVTTTPMKERLEEALLANQGYAWFGRERAAKLVNAILREMLEPSEGMQMAGLWAFEECDYGGDIKREVATAWRAMIQQILNESQD